MKPKYCPDCGKEIEGCQAYWSHSNWAETPGKPYYGVGYDCFCKHCGWSGHIEPDDESETIHRKEKK